ncbi:MAG: alpha/beta fold hydrolase [Desulfobacterales bacterium]|jgi:pimeloyl-ACP methyl ester carboxylesterase|nr:alpha/beta fold hydrolase [Desulfobacterales bacterium]
MTALLHCQRYGAGEPLLILHGLFGCWDNWHPVAKALAPRFRVYVPDLRNHGHSFHSPRFDYEAMADDVERLMDALAIDRAALLGHSMGGKVALRFTALRPDRVQRLIVVDITPKARRPAYGDAIDALARLDLSAIRGVRDADAKLRPIVTDPVVRLFLLKSLERLPSGTCRWKVNLDAIRRNLPLIFGAVAAAGVYAQPCLFIRGARSDYVQDSDWPDIQRAFPQARLVTIPGSGHWPHVENKAAFISAVEAFLAASG